MPFSNNYPVIYSHVLKITHSYLPFLFSVYSFAFLQILFLRKRKLICIFSIRIYENASCREEATRFVVCENCHGSDVRYDNKWINVRHI